MKDSRASRGSFIGRPLCQYGLEAPMFFALLETVFCRRLRKNLEISILAYDVFSLHASTPSFSIQTKYLA